MKDKTHHYFIVVLLLLISIFWIIGCSPKYHIKRAIKKDPTILVKDTIKYVDTFTVYTEHVEVDSVFMLSNDTTIIIKDNLTIKHFISRDSVFIYGECAADTIFVDREISIPNETIIIDELLLPKWVLWLGAIGFLLLIVNKIFKNKTLSK